MERLAALKPTKLVIPPDTDCEGVDTADLYAIAMAPNELKATLIDSIKELSLTLHIQHTSIVELQQTVTKQEQYLITCYNLLHEIEQSVSKKKQDRIRALSPPPRGEPKSDE